MGNKASDTKEEKIDLTKPNYITVESTQTNLNKNKVIIFNNRNVGNVNNVHFVNNNILEARKRTQSFDKCGVISFHIFINDKLEILKTYNFSLNEYRNACYCSGQKITSNLRECEYCENKKKSKSHHKKVRNSTKEVSFKFQDHNNNLMENSLLVTNIGLNEHLNIKDRRQSKSFNYKINSNSLYKEFCILNQTHSRSSCLEKNQKEISNIDSKSIVILDWDDTILCTTHLTPNGKFNEKLEICGKSAKKINLLQDLIIKFFEMKESTNSDIYIVTNASKLWIEYSAKRFLPKILNSMKNVFIISARDTFESYYVNNQRSWKLETFRLLMKLYKKDTSMNIMCIGDSFIEMEAVNLLVGDYFTKSSIKSIKLNESPTLDELIKQLNLLISQFPLIYSNSKSLNVTFQKKDKKQL